MKIKTIDINAKEWYDKINGNSYFSAIIILNYGMKKEKSIDMPFQYGYGDHYIDMANQELIKQGYIEGERKKWGVYTPLNTNCKENNIILRTNKQTGCKKREL